MTIEERLNYHEQFLASLERNVAALVEAQQRTDHNVSRLEQNVSRLEQGLSRMATTVTFLGEAVTNLVQVVEQVIRRLDELGQHQHDTDAKLDRLVDTVQKFIDAQLRRNGGD